VEECNGNVAQCLNVEQKMEDDVVFRNEKC